MVNQLSEIHLFTSAIEITQKMIEIMSEERSDYVEVTKLMLERGKIYSELDSLVKTLDRSLASDKQSIKQRYDELLNLDTNFRSLLKQQSDRLRSKTSTTKKDISAFDSYNKPTRKQESLFISSKLEG